MQSAHAQLAVTTNIAPLQSSVLHVVEQHTCCSIYATTHLLERAVKLQETQEPQSTHNGGKQADRLWRGWYPMGQG